MKIGLISDTHLPSRGDRLPPIVAETFHDVDLILIAGDLTTSSVIDELEAIAPTLAVNGNMDTFHDHALAPDRRIVTVEGHRVGLIHGWGAPDELPQRVAAAFQNDNVEAVVFGHSHYPGVQTVDNILLVNPGSPTDRRFAPCQSIGILHAEHGIPLRAEIIRI